MTRIIFTLAFFLGLVNCVLWHPQPLYKTNSNDPVTNLINYEREKEELQLLEENEMLITSATVKACDIRDEGYFAHTAPNGETPWDLIKEAGYVYAFAGENLARGFLTDTLAMEGLMNSLEHRKNIMSIEYKEVGIGRCGDIIVQHFGILQEEHD